MVCFPNTVEVECVVQDGTNNVVCKTFTLRAVAKIDELYFKVSSVMNYEQDSFVLLYQPPNAETAIDLKNSRHLTWLKMIPNCLIQKMTRTIIIKKIEQPPKNIPVPPPIINCDKMHFFPQQLEDSDGSRPITIDTKRRFAFKGTNLEQPISNAPSTETIVDSTSNLPEKNYVGLVNQAMTCYLNSLLQALYMTPEFRNALYNWEYTDGSEKDEACSIPYQLQKLFLNLQTSTKSAVETTSLTKSFGWDSTEAWQQHDIQELCRVMFDALETKFKDTEQADLINRLYEGKMIDYVKCLECKTEKSREDTFLDIPLPVRPFQSTVAYGSVEEALKAFVKYETLDGNNQYHCEKCNKKCDAHKGLKFTKFPYLLTLHLKRFDFDYTTLYRIKLNDKVTFPHYLDLNSFINTTPNQESSCGEEDAGMSVKCDDSSTTDSGTLEEDCPPCDGAISTNNHSNNHDQEDDEGIDMSNGHSTTNGIAHNDENDKNQEETCLTDSGPYVYELFSIMIHSGSASGGHYYAYIKDFKTKQWLCFNDTTVSPITESDIQKVYGGGPTRAYSSSTNAYMLMYRQIDPNKNALPMQEENFPQQIKTLLQKMKETEDDERRYHGKHSLTYKIKIYCHHPKTKKLMTNKLHSIAESTWIEQTEKAYEKFGLRGEVQLDQCRLVFYDPLNDLITHSYEGSDEDLICDIFLGDKCSDLLLEIREKDQQFETHKPDGIPIKVYVINVRQADIIDGPISIRGYQAQTVREFKEQLSKIINMNPEEINIAVNIFSNCLILQDEKTLEAEGFNSYSAPKMYVYSSSDVDNEKQLNGSANESLNSKLFSIIERFKKVIWLNFQLPDSSKDDLIIPSLENESKEDSVKPTNGLDEVSENDTSENGLEETCDKRPSNFQMSPRKSKAATHNCDKSTPSESFENNGIKWKAGLESTSEDSSLSDSEKTLVDDSSDGWKTIDQLFNSDDFCDSYDKSSYYFKAVPCTSEDNEKLLKVLVDERMLFINFKKRLEKYVGVPVDYFNVYFQPTDSPAAECINFRANFKHYNNGDRFCIKLGRALRKGELKLRLYQLHFDCPEEPLKYMFDWIVSKDMTVAQAKEEIIVELKQKYDLEIPFNRLRLRKKIYKSASTVLLNNSKFEDIAVSHDIIVQELPEDETVTEPTQIVLFVRRWSRSNLQLGPFQEVVLDSTSISELKEKINLLSNIPEEHIDIVKGRGYFPCENINLLDMETDLDWKQKLGQNVDKWPLCLENGSVVLYRDSSEVVKRLSSEEKREFANKENSRLWCLGTTPSYSSPRREKALKIYLDSK